MLQKEAEWKAGCDGGGQGLSLLPRQLGSKKEQKTV